jgi:hypothetical protein
MSGHYIKRAGQKVGPFTLKHFMLGENTGRRKKKTGDRFTGARLPFGGVVKSFVSLFVSKMSIFPSVMSLAAIALIDASSKAFYSLAYRRGPS